MSRHWHWKFSFLIGVLIALAAALAVVFAFTLNAARSVEKWNAEYSTWHVSQLEAEYWRLLETVGRYADRDTDIDRAFLDLRIDIFLSRLALIETGVAHARLLQIAGAAEKFEAVRSIIAAEEPALRRMAAGDAAEMQRIVAALSPVGPLLKDMTIGFELFETNGAVAAIQELRDNFVLGAVLIAALLITGLVLIGFLVAEISVRRKLSLAAIANQEQARIAREREALTLVEAGRRFLALARANPVPMLVCAADDGAIHYANPAAVSLLGLREDGGRPGRIERFFPEPTDLQALATPDAVALAAQRETQMCTSGGRLFPVAISARTLDYDGVPCFALAILDLSEKQAAELEIERQREIITHREKVGALGSLLAGVAHELNNPLSIVVAQATLLEEHVSDPATIARSTKIRAAAERCARIVKSFLAMARQRAPSRAAVNLNETVDSALELLGYGLRSAGIELERRLAPDLPTIWADPVQIGQVLTNLIVNAQQALVDQPEPRRLTVATRYDDGAQAAEVTITDNGPGIPADMRTRIFEPFFTTKPLGVGTGIGLSVCHSVLASHGGTIVAEEAPGGGARFVVRLPLGEPELHHARHHAREPLAVPGGRLLIVDDEPEVAATLAEILSRDGYAIDVVDDGAAAIAELHGGGYDLILSDIRMPGMNGMELHRRLQQEDPLLADRLIFVTGDALSASVQEFLARLARPRIEKPFIPTEVRRIVAAALSRQGAAQLEA